MAKRQQDNSNLIFIIIVVIVIIAMGIVIYIANNNANTSTQSVNSLVNKDNKLANKNVLSSLFSISLPNLKNALNSNVKATTTTPITGEPLLVKNNLPRVVYVGADYCPYCAAERWALIIALSKFGKFSNLRYMTSSSSDVYPSTATFTFYKSSYTSKYIDFTPKETNTNISSQGGYTSLETLTQIENNLINKFDAYPYVTKSSAGSIPFIDIGNKGLIVGAQYSPQLLQSMNWSQIASSIANTKSVISQNVLKSSASIIKNICKITNEKPQKVCSNI